MRRVVELAGMTEHCDFADQVSVNAEEDRQRPDLIVRLPAEREIVVDAKVSREAYLDAVGAETEDERKAAMARHAAQVRAHMDVLASKEYWRRFRRAPEFVVMFIPGESFVGAAVEADHRLIVDGLKQRVVLATPTTLIALLRGVASGWRQEQIAKSPQEIGDLGWQLYDRMRTMAEHIRKIGEGLEKASAAYNSAVGSLEGRVFPAARRFKELGAGTGSDILPMSPVDTKLRSVAPLEAIEGG